MCAPLILLIYNIHNCLKLGKKKFLLTNLLYLFFQQSVLLLKLEYSWKATKWEKMKRSKRKQVEVTKHQEITHSIDSMGKRDGRKKR